MTVRSKHLTYGKAVTSKGIFKHTAGIAALALHLVASLPQTVFTLREYREIKIAYSRLFIVIVLPCAENALILYNIVASAVNIAELVWGIDIEKKTPPGSR